ncbi:MAG: hypothetical protein P4L28_03365 [Paludibacteraceae bacterium]|nr:hypothetical protein [Paludibacteraceae bacterium]
MKKVILFAAVAATIALASCGKKAEAPAADSTKVDSAAVKVDTAKVDTAAKADTTKATAPVKK